MADKQTTRSRKPARAKATRKTTVRSTRKAPAVTNRAGSTLIGIDLKNPDVIGLP